MCVGSGEFLKRAVKATTRENLAELQGEGGRKIITSSLVLEYTFHYLAPGGDPASIP